MSTIEAIVLRRVVTSRAQLTAGALALHNFQLGLAKTEKEIVFRDDVGAFHYFKSDAANELKYSQLGHIHDDRYYTESEIDGVVDSLIYESSGVVTSPAPELVYNQDGTMTMPSMVVRIYDNPYYIGIPQKYTVPAKTFTPVDLQDAAIIAHYNNGNPEYRIIDAWNFGAYNLSDAVMVHRSWKAYGDLHSNSLGSTGLGAIEKVGLRFGQTMYYGRTGNVGLMLGSATTPVARTVTVTSANVWAGLTQVDVSAFNSSTDFMELLVRNAGVWSSQDVTQWPNTYYNNNSGLVTMSNNKYGVVWVYRTIGNVKEVFLVLGTDEHNTASEAEKESPRSDMDYIVYSHCMLVGRIIFQKNATTATDVQSAFEITFNSSIAQSHQALSDLQGGQAGQYYHLTQLEWETKILGLGITGRIPLYSAERQITSSILSGDANGIYPIANGTKALGSTSLRFSELWANTVYENGTSLALKYSPIGHAHDDRYYTESETNSLLSAKANSSDLSQYARLSGANFTGNITVSSNGTPCLKATRTISGDYSSTVVSVLAKAQATGNMGDGFGTAYAFQIQDSSGIENDVGRISVERYGADNTGKMLLSIYSSGTRLDAVEISAEGVNISGSVVSSDITAYNTGYVLKGREVGDAYSRVALTTTAAGAGFAGIAFGSGSSDCDVFLYRLTSTSLKTDAKISAKSFRFNDDTIDDTGYTTIVSGTNADYSPVEGSNKNYSATPTAGGTSITLSGLNMTQGAIAFLTVRNNGTNTLYSITVNYTGSDGISRSVSIQKQSQTDFLILRSGSGLKLIGNKYS